MHVTQAQKKAINWYKAWSWLPVLLLLSLASPRIYFFHISAIWLVLPIALWLGHCYGRVGLAVMAVGGLGFGLPLYVRTAYGGFLANTGVYIAALILAWVAYKRNILTRLAWRPNTLWHLPILLGILAVALSLWGKDYGLGIKAGFYLLSHVLIYMMMFSLGLSRISLGIALGSVALATFVGMLLDTMTLPRDASELMNASHAYLPLIGMTELQYLTANYILDTPREFLTATGYMLFGRSLRDIHSRVPIKHIPLVIITIILGLFLAMGKEINDSIVNNIVEPDNIYTWLRPAYTKWLGAAEAIPLVSMIAGRYLGYWGILFLLAGVVTMWGLEGGILSDRDLNLDINLVTPLYVFGFGTVGIQIRDHFEGTSSPWWSWSWALYLLSVAIVLSASWLIEEEFDVLSISMTFVAVTALSLAMARLWHRLFPEQQRHTGWLALTALGLLIYSANNNSQAFWEALSIMAKQIEQLWAIAGGAVVELEFDYQLLITSLGILLAGVVILCLQKVLKEVDNLAGDLIALAQLLHSRLRVQPEAIKSVKFGVSHSRGVLNTFQGLFGRIGWASVAISLVLPVTFGSWAVWSWLADEFHTNTEQRRQVSTSSNNDDLIPESLDPYLLKAVQSFTDSWTTKEVNFKYGKLKYETYHYQLPDNPDERFRIWISVGLVNTHLNDLSLTERHEQALFTYVTRFEKGRFGLWVKQDTMKDFEREKAIESKIRASILTHAEDLSSKNKGD